MTDMNDTGGRTATGTLAPIADAVRSGRVSITSPIARALMGKTVGDTVEVSTPGGGRSYEVVGVTFG